MNDDQLEKAREELLKSKVRQDNLRQIPMLIILLLIVAVIIYAMPRHPMVYAQCGILFLIGMVIFLPPFKKAKNNE